MLQSSASLFVLYASQRIACYFLHHETISTHHNSSNILFISNSMRSVKSVTQTKVHRKAVPKTTQSATSEQLCSVLAASAARTLLPLPHYKPKRSRPTATRHLSVHSVTISVTSPFGYRRDPFTKRKALHNGLDSKANYEPTYAIIHGEVIKVGKDKRSGLLCHPPYGELHRQLCHLSPKLSSPKAPTSVPASSSR